MFNTIASETIKLFSLRSTWIYLILSAGAMFGSALLTALAFGPDTPLDLTYLFTGADLSLIIVIFAAAMMASADLTKGTVAWSYLMSNNRLGQLGAQVPIIALAVTLAATVGVALSVPGVYLLGGSLDFTVTTDVQAVITSSYAQWLIFTLLAAMLAVLLRSGAFSAMILIADIFVVEAMLGMAGIAALKPFLDLLPLANIRVLAAGEFGDVSHGPLAAGIILAITVAVFFGVTGWVANRRAVR
ncbi:ABC transporter permease [Corynebacterium halotolerans]|uniref:ABC transporter permease n=1 Tax=Corynebacterium halotolerans TaxID=225326 RepID=UPI003CEF6E00